MTMRLSGLQPVSQCPEALPPMIEALIRVLVEALGLPLVQGLGYLFLHGLRLWRDPSEAACTVIGLLGWGGITLAVLAWLGTPYQRAVRRVPSARFGRQCRGDTGGGITRMSRITAALAAVAMLAACAADGGDRVHLRIRNSSPFVFSHVWQGFPQRWTDHDFGRLAPCQPAIGTGFRRSCRTTAKRACSWSTVGNTSTRSTRCAGSASLSCRRGTTRSTMHGPWMACVCT